MREPYQLNEETMKKRLKTTILITLYLFILSCIPALAEKIFAVNDRVKVLWRGKWEVCIVLEAGDSRYKVHFEDNEEIFDKWVPSRIVQNYTYKLGETVMVSKDGKWLPAQVIASGSSKYKIHFQGLESVFDEWVGPDRIEDLSFQPGEKIMVFWQEDWYEAKVLRYKDGQYLVHFEGFPDSEDQWVTVDRMKKQ
jgi:hypothetical protein